MINFNLNGKVAVITGGAGILCTTMAKELAKVGIRVAVLDIAKDRAQEVAADIVANGGEAIGVGADVLNLDSLESGPGYRASKIWMCGYPDKRCGWKQDCSYDQPDRNHFLTCLRTQCNGL